MNIQFLNEFPPELTQSWKGIDGELLNYYIDAWASNYHINENIAILIVNLFARYRSGVSFADISRILKIEEGTVVDAVTHEFFMKSRVANYDLRV